MKDRSFEYIIGFRDGIKLVTLEIMKQDNINKALEFILKKLYQAELELEDRIKKEQHNFEI